MTTTGTVAGSGLLSDGTAWKLLVTGIGLSVLLGLLVYVLGTGRERARRLVAQRTGELRFQALHGAFDRVAEPGAGDGPDRAVAGPQPPLRDFGCGDVHGSG